MIAKCSVCENVARVYAEAFVNNQNIFVCSENCLKKFEDKIYEERTIEIGKCLGLDK